jgi:tetratricopeptide (TPR) repeat protein
MQLLTNIFLLIFKKKFTFAASSPRYIVLTPAKKYLSSPYHNVILHCALTLLLLFSPQIFFAQNSKIDSLRKVLLTMKDDTNKVNTLNILSHKLEGTGSYDSSLLYAHTAEALAEKTGFESGLAKAYIHIGNIYIDRGNYPLALEYENKALTISRGKEDKAGISTALGNIGNIYNFEGNYSKALEYYFNSLSIDQELGNKNDIGIDFGNIGNVYSNEGNDPKTLEYYLKALKITQEIGDKEGSAINLANIGNVYHDEGNYPKALESYLKALSVEQELGDKDAMATNMHNIGQSYADEGNTSKALEYYLMSLQITKALGDKNNAAAAMDDIGSIYLLKGNYPDAQKYYYNALTIAREIRNKKDLGNFFIDIGNTYILQKNYKLSRIYLDSALEISQKTGEKKHSERTYRALAKLDSAVSDYKAAYDDYKNYILYRDSVTNKESIKKLAKLEVSYEFERKEDSIKASEEETNIIKAAETKRKSIITYGMVVILLLSLISATLLISRQKIKHKKNTLLFEKNIELSEKEKDVLKLEKQHMEDELAAAKMVLTEYLESMEEKNKLLEEFKADVEKLKSLNDKESTEQRIKNLEYLNKATILTDEDWNKFKQLFEQVHKDFFKRLREKLPDLTQAEVRMICLTKLNLGTKQMAGILGVSFDTIRKSRYRLRKKLGLAEEDRIDDIVESI